jgi:hypothetical protein
MTSDRKSVSVGRGGNSSKSDQDLPGNSPQFNRKNNPKRRSSLKSDDKCRFMPPRESFKSHEQGSNTSPTYNLQTHSLDGTDITKILKDIQFLLEKEKQLKERTFERPAGGKISKSPSGTKNVHKNGSDIFANPPGNHDGGYSKLLNSSINTIGFQKKDDPICKVLNMKAILYETNNFSTPDFSKLKATRSKIDNPAAIFHHCI